MKLAKKLIAMALGASVLLATSVNAATFTGSGGTASITNVGAAGLAGATFTGGGTFEASGTVNMTLTPDLSTIGDLIVTISGDMTGVNGITFANLNGGTSALTLGANSATTTLEDGSTNVANAAVTFIVDGTTNLDSRIFRLTVSFDSDAGAGDDETIINNEILTNWGNHVEAVSAFGMDW